MQTEFARLRKQAALPFDVLETKLGLSSRTLRRYESGAVTPKPPVIEALRRLAVELLRDDDGKPSFRFIDLFAGIGGLRKGFDRLGGKCVFTSEWNEYAQRTYLANFHDSDDHILMGDIRDVAVDDVPEHEVLLAGFPCQPFSIAGVSKKNALGREHGFKCEAQGTLFFDVARILDHRRPAAFLLENVKNLVNHTNPQSPTCLPALNYHECSNSGRRSRNTRSSFAPTSMYLRLMLSSKLVLRFKMLVSRLMIAACGRLRLYHITFRTPLLTARSAICTGGSDSTLESGVPSW